MRLSWPLTGRSEEMRLVEAALSDPDSLGLVVCGGAGVGKSRMVREALTSAAFKGCETRWAVATSTARMLPLGTFVSWAAPAGGSALELVRGVVESLTSAPAGTQVVVGVDDVHLLDDLSTFVLQQIVSRRAAHLVLTVRDGEPVPGAIQEIWKGRPFKRLDLQPLSRDESTTLVSATLSGSVDPDAAGRLWKLTLGNVLYLRNIVEQEVADGRLVRERECWRWIGEPVIPPGLIELIQTRIGALPAPVIDVVDALAVGEPIELASLKHIADAVAVEEAYTRGLITLETVRDGVEARVAHPLYGEVRRRCAARVRLRRLRGLVAAELSASDACDDVRVVVRRATLSMDSDLQPDPDLLLRAAQGALGFMDIALADRLAEAAIRAGAAVEAKVVRAWALSMLSRGHAADDVLADIPLSELPDSEHARLVILRANNRLWSMADPAGAKKIVDDALRSIPPQARNSVDAFVAYYWALMGKPDAARDGMKSLTLDELPAELRSGTAALAAFSEGLAGRTSQAVAAAQEGYAVVGGSLDAARLTFSIGDAHLRALVLSGRIQEAIDVAELLGQQVADLPAAVQLIFGALRGRAALGAGRVDAASSLLEPVTEVMIASGDPNGADYLCLLPRTIALAMRGLTDEAAAALATVEKRRHPGWRCADYEWELARAWVSACQGAVTEAITSLLAAAAAARADGRFATEVVSLQTATQFGDRSGARRLRELAAIVEGPRVGLAARFASALRAGDAAELAAVSEEFEGMGDLVAAVDVAAHAAMAYRRQDRRGSALRCATRAEAIAEGCGADTPALRRATERLPLTDREREIVMLLGQGMSSGEIAARLTVSVRTVEGHVYHAMVKTGITSRDDLAALLRHREPKLRGEPAAAVSSQPTGD